MFTTSPDEIIELDNFPHGEILHATQATRIRVPRQQATHGVAPQLLVEAARGQNPHPWANAINLADPLDPTF